MSAKPPRGARAQFPGCSGDTSEDPVKQVPSLGGPSCEHAAAPGNNYVKTYSADLRV
jgi:hypothetical protein